MAATKRQAAGLTNAIPRATLNDEELVSTICNIKSHEFVIEIAFLVLKCIKEQLSIITLSKIEFFM